MNPIVERKVSGFQLSISTGMAMETLFNLRGPAYDKDRTPPPKVSLSDYQAVYINIDTLLRNIINAATYSDARQLRPDMVGEALCEEIELIQNLCTIEGRGSILPVFYDTSYASFYRAKTPEYQLRLPTTEKQIAWFRALEGGKQFCIQKGYPVTAFGETGIRPTKPNQKALIMSHVAPDLLSYRNFDSLELLESHTGKIKTRRQWNTKYSPMGSEKFENMPWCKPLLCWLGDQHVLSPLSITIRKKIFDLSKLRRWTPMTESATVHNDCLTKIPEESITKILRQITLY